MKRDTVSYWKDKLDKVFAPYIRQRDGINGKGQCISCGELFDISLLDAGHFRSRKYNATRYDEKNVQLQCRGCNRFNSGEQYKFGIALDEKYGEGTALGLTRKSHEIKKFTVAELKDLHQYYKEKLKIMEGK